MKQKKKQRLSGNPEKEALNASLNEIIEMEAEKKEEPFPMSIILCMGVSLGMVFGLLFDSIAMGMCIGAAVGLAVCGIPALAKAFKKRAAGMEDSDNKTE